MNRFRCSCRLIGPLLADGCRPTLGRRAETASATYAPAVSPGKKLAQEGKGYACRRRLDGMEQPSVKQGLGVDEIAPAGFESGDALRLETQHRGYHDTLPKAIHL